MPGNRLVATAILAMAISIGVAISADPSGAAQVRRDPYVFDGESFSCGGSSSSCQMAFDPSGKTGMVGISGVSCKFVTAADVRVVILSVLDPGSSEIHRRYVGSADIDNLSNVFAAEFSSFAQAIPLSKGDWLRLSFQLDSAASFSGNCHYSATSDLTC